MDRAKALQELQSSLNNSFGLALRKAMKSPREADFEAVVVAALGLRDELESEMVSNDLMLALWALVATEASGPVGVDAGESADARRVTRQWFFVLCQMVELMLIGSDLDDVLVPFERVFGRRPHGF